MPYALGCCQSAIESGEVSTEAGMQVRCLKHLPPALAGLRAVFPLVCGKGVDLEKLAA